MRKTAFLVLWGIVYNIAAFSNESTIFSTYFKDIVPLEGGYSHAILYTVNQGKTSYVLRIKGEHCTPSDWRAETMAAIEAGKLGIGPKVHKVFHRPKPAFLMGFAHGFYPNQKETYQSQTFLRLLGQQFARLHHSSIIFPRSHTPQEEVSTISEKFPPDWLPPLAQKANRIATRVLARFVKTATTPCHLDLHPANLLYQPAQENTLAQLTFLDWEYAAMGHPLFDLAFTAHTLNFSDTQHHVFLEAYYGRPPTHGELETLKQMRKIATWIGAYRLFNVACNAGYPGFKGDPHVLSKVKPLSYYREKLARGELTYTPPVAYAVACALLVELVKTG